MELANPFGEKVPSGGKTHCVDIEGKAIVRLDPKSGDERVWQLDQRIGCIAPCSDGHLLYAGDRGIARFNLETEVSVALCDPESNRPDNRFNDGKCDPSGRFWAGTINTKKVTGTAALYCTGIRSKNHIKTQWTDQLKWTGLVFGRQSLLSHRHPKAKHPKLCL